MVGEEHGDGNAQQVMHPSFLRILEQKKRITERLAGIKHKICIYSAKGGVGKTTVAVNLAYALRAMGYSVGLLDADVDTPNVNLFLGIEGSVEAKYPLVPVAKDGVRVVSTALFLDDQKKPIMWRGPIIGKMVSEFFEETEWGALDYLIVDLGPGTSDAPLSIMQLLQMDGFVLVTTPQHIAAVNAIRSGRMARRLGVSILGVVENMSEGNIAGGKEVAEALECPVLGSIPRDARYGALSDAGSVPVDTDSGIMELFKGIASRIIEGR
jgi:ATP-binding protein involved in chromosome partitioning